MNPVWRRTLESLLEKDGLPLTAIPQGIRRELEQWGRRTGTLEIVQQGRGSRLRVVNADHLRALVRQEFPADPPDDGARARVRNLAYARDTKAGATRLDVQYLLGKTVGALDVHVEAASRVFDLVDHAATLGCFALPLSATFPGWEAEAPVLLVENQLLFDRLEWLPLDWNGILFYYAGNLSDLHLEWLARCRFPSVTLFADYDGIGLRNYSRLRDVVPGAQWHWESDWENALTRYGNQDLWRTDRQRADFDALWKKWEEGGWPDVALRPLMESMRRTGRMLEQEWVLAR